MTDQFAAYSSVSEPGGGDFSANTSTAGRVAVGGAATGEIGASRDRDWFAVELVAGRTYTIDLKGHDTDDGELIDPYLRGIHDADGKRISDTKDDDGGVLRNSQLTFVATESGTHYIAAGAHTTHHGTYTVEVTDNSPPEAQQQVVQEPPAFDAGAYAFVLAENADGSTARVSLGTVSATDPEGDTLAYSLEGGNASGLFEIDAASGELFYVGAGEDFEAGTAPFDLTVRASDGDLSVDTAVTVTVTDVLETATQLVQQPPAFGVQGYAFTLPENADGSTDRVSLGTVSASDPEGAALGYSLEGGNGSGRFEIDAASGELFYAGTGEDFEAGTGPFELTVRASDGDLFTDTSVVVGVADVQEVPAFGQQGYAFDLAENSDGSTTRVSLGTVAAVDPDGTALSYSIEGGNASGLFEIDAASDELFYTGTGEDFEAGSTSFELTVRASDGTHAVDTTVTVSVTDMQEDPTVDPHVSESQESVSEPDGEDFSANTSTAGRIAVDGAATGNIGSSGDRDWYAVELVAGVEYRIDLEGSETGVGTLADPLLRWLHDSGGAGIRGTRNDDGGQGDNARQEFTPTESGTYYISANGKGSGTGTYRLSVTQVSPPAQEAPDFGQPSYAFALAENADGSTARVSLGTVSVMDPEGVALSYSIEGGNASGRFEIDAASGELFYTGTGEDFEAGTGPFELTVRAGDGNLFADTTVTVSVADVPEAPAFGEQGYAFDLAENTDGSTSQVSLGTVAATDPEGVALVYSLEGGNASGRFEIDAASGELFYVGTGEDFEAGTAPFELTVRASDGSLSVDTTATVGVTDVPELPGLGVADAEAHEGTDAALRFQVLLDQASSETVAVSYATEDGTATAGTDYTAASGVLTFTPGETEKYVEVAILDDTHEDGGETLTLRLSDASGASLDDAEATGTILNSDSSVSEPDGEDFSADTSTGGRVVVGESVTGNVEALDDRDWFAVDLMAGKSYRIDLEGSPTGAGTLQNPYIRGVYSSSGDLLANTQDNDSGVSRNSRAYITPAADTTYYIAAGSSHGGAGVTSPAGTYKLSVTEISDDYQADSGTSGAVTVGGSASGEIEKPGDRDWFAITLEAGITYRIDLKHSGPNGEALQDPYLRGIYDSNGNLLANTQNNDGGPGDDSRVYFTAAADGTHYIAAGGNGSHTGTYEVSVTTFPDDHPSGTSTSGTVTVGGSADGKVERPWDQDWFAVDLEGGWTYRIDLEGLSLSDTYLHGIFDSNGARVAAGDDDGGNGSDSRIFFTPSADGTYYIAARAYLGHTGTYRLSATKLSDDYKASTATTGEVTVGGPAAGGNISREGDRDWFAVDLEGGRTYRIDQQGRDSWDGTLRDPHLGGVYDSEGRRVAQGNEDGGSGLNSRIWLTPEDDGTYYIAAGSDYVRIIHWGWIEWSWTGTYEVSVKDFGADDFPDDTTGAVAVGGSVEGELHYSRDKDWFAVELEAGGIYRFNTYGSAAGDWTLSTPVLSGIYDSNRNPLYGEYTGSVWGSGSYGPRFFYIPEQDGTYLVPVSTPNSGSGTYKLSVTQIPAVDDHPADTSTGGTVTVGTSASGKLEEPGDRDWFAVDLQGDRNYWIDLRGRPTEEGNLPDPKIWGIHDANGVLIAGTVDDDSGDGDGVWDNGRVFFNPEADGTYYISAGGSEDYWGNEIHTGTYKVSVRDTGGEVAVDGSADGEVKWTHDRKWFDVTLQAGHVYVIDLEGSSTGRGTLDDPRIYGVYNQNRNLIPGTFDQNHGIGDNARLVFSPQTDGTYYIEVGKNWEHGGSIGTFQVSVTDITNVADDWSDGTDTSATVSVGGPLAKGTIESPEDRDWFKVVLEAGKTYQVDLMGSCTGAGTLEDPYLWGIHDSNGGLIANTRDDDGGVLVNSRVEFTPDAGGIYYIAAGGYDASQLGTYELTVEEVL